MKMAHASFRSENPVQDIVDRFNQENDQRVGFAGVSTSWPTHPHLLPNERDGKTMIGTVSGSAKAFTRGVYAKL